MVRDEGGGGGQSLSLSIRNLCSGVARSLSQFHGSSDVFSGVVHERGLTIITLSIGVLLSSAVVSTDTGHLLHIRQSAQQEREFTDQFGIISRAITLPRS